MNFLTSSHDINANLDTAKISFMLLCMNELFELAKLRSEVFHEIIS